MKMNDLVQLRLENQGLRKATFKSGADVVKWFCAIQAQDYLGSLWTIGQRLPKALESEIEKEIADRKIVRTWPMRGTLHFVSPDDIRWMVKLLAPRIINKSKSLYKEQGLDAKTLDRGKKIIEDALQKKSQLTRPEIYEALGKRKIQVTEQRGIHLIGFAAQEGLICFGPRDGKQHTFVLLDEWIPKSKLLTVDESLAELASRYFESHGPATAQDFSWWSGLTLTEVKRSIEMIEKELVKITVDDQQYWMKPVSSIPKSKALQLSLLSWFDEYIIGYKDRTAAFDPATQKFIEKPKNGLYTPMILINGKIAGSWKRSFVKKDIKIETTSFRNFDAKESNALNAVVKKYKSFLNNGDDQE
jgi:hypothetical protein